MHVFLHVAHTAGYHEPVSKLVLEEAHRVRKFAVGAYGLQSVLWAKGRWELV